MKSRNIIILVIGLFFGSVVGAGAVTLCNAKDILYSPNDNAWDIDTVDDALNDLYEIVNGNSTKPTEPILGNIAQLIKSKSKGDISLINFNTPADDTETGVYKTTGENDAEVYFYRGNVTDNNIIFGNFCWKMVRTTESGGTKLLYNGTPENGECNKTGDAALIGKSAYNTIDTDNAYVGYMYGKAGSATYEATTTNTNNSTIKGIIDRWYYANIKGKEWENLLEDAIWCNDRSFVKENINSAWGQPTSDKFGFGKKVTLYGIVSRSSFRTKNVNPSLICPNNNDKFTVSGEVGNGALTYPIGLLTMDEIVFGGYTSEYNPDGGTKNSAVGEENYLSSKSGYWSMSPEVFSGGYAQVGWVAATNKLYVNTTDFSRGVRPAISLNSTAEIIEGDGSGANPYIVR